MKALCTFGTDGYRQLLKLTGPRMAAYAGRHGYDFVWPRRGEDLFEVLAEANRGRPPSWMKIALLNVLLDSHEQVLWLDADVLVCDDSQDLADELPDGAWQAMVRHHTLDGEVPNCGVWLVRPAMQPVLRQLWTMTQYNHDGWYEQAALVELLGYERAPCRLLEPTELYENTRWLPLEWNSHEQNDPHPQPRFAHATCGDLTWRQNVIERHLERSPAHA
jgi:hypothetical protein